MLIQDRQELKVSRFPLYVLLPPSFPSFTYQSYTCRCSNHAKIYNDDVKMWVCGTHDNMVKASGICVICMDLMGIPGDRVNLECRHTFHKQCVCQLDMHCCPCCRAPIIDKYAKRVFSNSKIVPLADKVFSLRPAKQKAFFDITKTLVDILDNVSEDTDEGAKQIMMLKSYISTYAFGVKSLGQHHSIGVEIMADWSEAATTAFEHIRQYETYDGLAINTNGINFWVVTNPPPQEEIAHIATDRIVTNEQPFIPAQEIVDMPRDPRIPHMQFVPVVQPGQVAQLRPADNAFGNGDVGVVPFDLDVDMEWDQMHSRPNSPVSPSIIHL